MAPNPPGDEPAAEHTPEPSSTGDVFDYDDYVGDDYGAGEAGRHSAETFSETYYEAFPETGAPAETLAEDEDEEYAHAESAVHAESAAYSESAEYAYPEAAGQAESGAFSASEEYAYAGSAAHSGSEAYAYAYAEEETYAGGEQYVYAQDGHDHPAGQVPEEQPVEQFPVAGPLAQNYPAETGYDDDPRLDIPTAEWPAPGEEETDPVGFDPVYQPPGDPYDDADYDHDYNGTVYDELPLPGWGAATGEQQARGRRVRRYRRTLLVSGFTLFLAGLAAVILMAPRWIGGSDKTEAAGPSGVSDDQVTGPVDGRTAALFELVDGAASVQVKADDLGDDLYRVTTPAGSEIKPTVEADGDTVRLHLPAGSNGGPTEVVIVLNKSVRWTLQLDGGTAETAVDLSEAEVDGVDLQGGAKRIDLTLPVPTSVMPVRMTGGVDQFTVRLAGETPVRVQVQSGAGEVTLDGDTHRGIAPGQSFTANGWDDDAAGVDLQAVAGMGGLTVTEE